MHIRWTKPASDDLNQICDYINEHDSAVIARRVALSIYERVSTLAELPERGRPGRKIGTRELIFTGSAISCNLSRPQKHAGNPAYSSRRAEVATMKRPGSRCRFRLERSPLETV
jgi:plasmid stabilization system protein ParE